MSNLDESSILCLDHIVEMKKLNHSILVNYMELLDVMIEAPASPEVCYIRFYSLFFVYINFEKNPRMFNNILLKLWNDHIFEYVVTCHEKMKII